MSSAQVVHRRAARRRLPMRKSCRGVVRQRRRRRRRRAGGALSVVLAAFPSFPPEGFFTIDVARAVPPPAVTPEPLPRALPASGLLLLLLRRRHRGGLLSQAHGISSRAPASRSATALTRARAVAAATPPHDTAACTGLPRAIVLRRQAEVLEIFLAESAGRRAPREGRSGAVILRRGTTASTCKRKKSIASDACGRGQICEEKNTTGKEGVLGGTVDALLTGLA